MSNTYIPLDLPETDFDATYDFELGMSKRLKQYRDTFSELTPRKQARFLFAQNFIRALRISGLSQKELSGMLGASASLISGWANAVSMPSGKHLAKLSEIFNTDVTAWMKHPPVPFTPATFSGNQDSCNVSNSVTMTVTPDEEALIQRVRRMSEDERSALYTLFHVLR